MYRKNVMMVLRSPGGKYLLSHKSGAEDFDWYFPGGGIEEGESIMDAFYREIYEELGVRPGDLKNIEISPIRHKYEWGEDLKNSTGFVGQDQSIVIGTLKKDVSIDLKISNELDEFKWVSLNDAQAIIPHKGLLLTITELIKLHGLV